MAGRTPALAVDLFLDRLQRAANCLFLTPLYASGHEPGRLHAIAFQVPGAQRLPSLDPWYLRFVLNYELHEGDDVPGRWQVTPRQYIYELQHPAGRRILGYHWHPGLTSRIQAPHLHVHQHDTPVNLARKHLPTSQVGFDAVLRFAIEELQVTPRRQDWRAILDATGAAFRAWRTWEG